MTAAAPGQPTSARDTLAITVVFLLLQVAAVFNPSVVEVDPEESYNAGHALQLLHGHFGDIFRLQYRPFCGGCTADALLAAPLFAALGDSWLVWKLVPIAFGAMAIAVGHRRLRVSVGPAAATCFAALMLFPPRAWLHLSLIGWGNHQEAGALALVSVALLIGRPRPFLSGLAAGLAVYVSFSGAFAWPAAALWLLLTRQVKALPWLVLGGCIGVAPWALQWWSTGEHAFVTIYEAGESAPSVARIQHKLATLFAPRQLIALFGHPRQWTGWALGGLATAGWAVCIVASCRRRSPAPARAALLFLGAWLSIYLVVRFQVYDPPWPQIAVAGSTRYAAPLYLPLMLLAASVAGAWWTQGRRALVGVALAGPLIAGLVARVETLSPPFPALGVTHLEAVDWDYFRHQYSYLLRPDAHAACTSTDLRARQLHAYGHGRESATAAMRRTNGPDLTLLSRPSHLPSRQWWEGVGDAQLAWLDDRTPDTLGIMRAADSLLHGVRAYSDDDAQDALRTIAWSRIDAGEPWSQARHTHDADAIIGARAALVEADDAVRRAAWWAIGRAWARDVVGWHEMRETSLPAGSLPTAFVEGFGAGLGEEWGPREQLTRPRGLRSAQESALLDGYAWGQSRRWRPGPATRLANE